MHNKFNLLSIAVAAALTAACSGPGSSSSGGAKSSSSSSSSSSTSSSSSSSTSTSSSSSSSSSSGLTLYQSVKGGFIAPTFLGLRNYYGYSGMANLVIRQDQSELEIHVSGLSQNAHFKAIVQDGTCELATEPYTNATGAVFESDLVVNSSGMGMGQAVQPQALRDTNLSLMLKEVDRDLVIGCADLHSSGGLKGVNGYGKSFFNNWVAYLSVNDKGRSIAELTPGMYNQNEITGPVSASLNTSSCFAQTLIPYLQDPLAGNNANNTLQPSSADAQAQLGFWASNLFTLRLNEAKSIAINYANSWASSLDCIELTDKILIFRSGSFTATATGVALYGTLFGRAILETSERGVTTVNINMSGLKPNTTYSNHVHNGLCADAGGGHYLHDLHGSDNAVNGMFPVFTTDNNGRVAYSLSATKIVRPDARSVVIHEPGSGAKIACADLE